MNLCAKVQLFNVSYKFFSHFFWYSHFLAVSLPSANKAFLEELWKISYICTYIPIIQFSMDSRASNGL